MTQTKLALLQHIWTAQIPDVYDARSTLILVQLKNGESQSLQIMKCPVLNYNIILTDTVHLSKFMTLYTVGA